jgi:hypothetical protein
VTGASVSTISTGTGSVRVRFVSVLSQWTSVVILSALGCFASGFRGCCPSCVSKAHMTMKTRAVAELSGAILVRTFEWCFAGMNTNMSSKCTFLLE